MNKDKSRTHKLEGPSSSESLARQARQLEEDQLLESVKGRLPQLKELLAEMSSRQCYDDPIHQFYHHSFYVYDLQKSTMKIVTALRELAPHLKLGPDFEQILADGTGKTFEMSHNEDWHKHTRPIVEAFFHARHMLEMAVRYVELPEPRLFNSGWAAVLYLFDLR